MTEKLISAAEVEELAERMAAAVGWGHSSSCATSEFVDRDGPCDCGALKMWRTAAEVAIRALPDATPSPGEEERLRAAERVVAEQAWHEALWCVPETAFEDYLQRELRKLHAAVEGKSPEECARAALHQKPEEE